MAEQAKGLAALCTALTWIGFLIAILSKKDDSYVMHYGKQGLALAIAWFLLMILMFVLTFVSVFTMFIPGVGWIVSILIFLFTGVSFLAMIIFWIWGIINALSGEKKSLPIIGKIAEMLPF